MPEQLQTVNTSQVFPGFELHASVPDSVQLLPSGLLGSQKMAKHGPAEGTLVAYVVRRTVKPVGIRGDPGLLYNGQLHPDGKPPTSNATEGHGLYFGSTPNASRVHFVPGEHEHVLRIEVPSGSVLDAFSAELDRSATPEQKRAARWLRWRGVVPGLPGPGVVPGKRRTEVLERWYGNRRLIVYPPLALARLTAGTQTHVDGVTIPAKWGLLRDGLGGVEVVGHRHMPGRR